MATVIGALTVSLGLDASNFTRGQRDMLEQLKKMEQESNRVGKSVSAHGDQLADVFRKAKIEALALYGVLTGGSGLARELMSTAAGMNALQRAATGSGENTQWLQAFGAAIGRTGGDVAAARQQMVQFAATVTAYRLRGGLPGIAQYADQLGINPNTAQPHEIIEGIMRMMERPENSKQFMLHAMSGEGGMGLGQDLALSLMQIGSTAALHAAIRRSYELGAVQTQQQIDAGIEFQKSVTAFKQAVDGMVTAAIPFEKLAGAINRLTEIILNPKKEAGARAGFRTLKEITDAIIPEPEWFKRWFRHGTSSDVEPGLIPSPTGARGGPRTDGAGALTSAQRALLGAISGAEASDYNIRYGERPGQGTLDLNGPHPGRTPSGHSPAGIAQFTELTWREGITALGLPNVMSRANQEAVFAYLLRKRGVTDDMITDPSRRDEMLRRLRDEWPSVPTGGQPNPATGGFDQRLKNGLSPLGPRQMLKREDMQSPGSYGPLIGNVPYNVSPTPGPQSNNSSEMHIGNVNVYPPNGDSKTIAQTIERHLTNIIINSSNTGMA